MIEIRKQDALELLASMDDGTIDAILIDPPYGAIKPHKIETEIDWQRYYALAFQKLKKESFLCVFGLMPHIVEHFNSAINAGFRFRQDIVWVKRAVTSPYLPIVRQKELIYIFSKGYPKYRKTTGPYEDVAMPYYLDGLRTIRTFKRYISDLKLRYEKNIETRTHTLRKNDKIYHKYTPQEKIAPEQLNFTDVWSFLSPNKIPGTGIEHPTVKPLELMERLVELTTDENDLVVDTFVGSGTTAVAAMKLGRKFIGCEIFDEYIELARNRIAEEKNQNNSKIVENQKKQLTLFDFL